MVGIIDNLLKDIADRKKPHLFKWPNRCNNYIHILRVNNEVKWSEVAQWCTTLCDPMDCSLPGSPIHGIFQARILEWVANEQ